MRGQLVLLTTSMLASAVFAATGTVTQSIVRASPALVEIELRAPGRSLITLPGLEFPLLIEPSCADDADVAFVSISVADTRKTFAAAEFIEKSSLETVLRVPQRQLSPLAIEQFCTDDGRAASEQSIRLEDAFTAHVSLRCSGEAGHSVIYETLPLDVTVRCVTAGSEQPGIAVDGGLDDQPIDQESSSSLRRF